MIPLLTSLVAALALASAPAEAEKLRVCLVSGSEEYDSDRSLDAFAQYLEAHYPADCVVIKAIGFDELPGTEELDRCDLAVFFTRRLKIDGEALARVRRFAEGSGKPVVGIRTASHGFQNWLEMDALIFGGNYRNHYKNDVLTEVKPADGAEGHFILDGFEPYSSKGSLYKVLPLAGDCTPLLLGTSPEATEPVAWTREVGGRRVFYTSLGHPDDFQREAFRRLLARGIFWAARREESAGR